MHTSSGSFCLTAFSPRLKPFVPFAFFANVLSRPGIAKYEKEHATCVPNDRGDLNLKWVVSEGNKNKHCRQTRYGDNNEHSPFFEKDKAGDSRALGIAVCDRETFDQGHIAIGAAVYVGRYSACIRARTWKAT